MLSGQAIKHYLTLDPTTYVPPTRNKTVGQITEHPPPRPKATHLHPTKPNTSQTNASLFFIGTATTLLEWRGIRILTDPNFLHAGDHVHLGPGVQGTRVTNPAIDLEALPRIDAVLLSHYHADHFDEKVEEELRRDLKIVTTPHAKGSLVDKKTAGEKFEAVYDLDFWETAMLDVLNIDGGDGKLPAVKVTGMPGKHVPPGPLSVANDLLHAVPPTNGWMVELGYRSSRDAGNETFQTGYRIYISGDTLMVDELKEIPERYKGRGIDLMLIHLGGTTIPSPKVPLLMVTMDATQGIQLMRLIQPDLTIPIHYDDYDVFLSPLDDFKKAVDSAGWNNKVVYLDRAEEFKFHVRDE